MRNIGHWTILMCLGLLGSACSKDVSPSESADVKVGSDSAARATEGAALDAIASSESALSSTSDDAESERPVSLDGDPSDPSQAFKMLRQGVAHGLKDLMKPLLTKASQNLLDRVPLKELGTLLAGELLTEPVLNGGRAVLTLTRGTAPSQHLVFLQRAGTYRLDIQKSVQWRDLESKPKDVLDKPVSLAEAVADLPGTGRLWVTLKTSMGDFNCQLFERRAPKTVANFVALARGKRAFLDVASGQWVKGRRFYDGLGFHRVLPNFMIQAGDPSGTGDGGPGYRITDEFDLSLRHDRGGLMSMANSGPNTGGSQFFITEVATPWLDDAHTIFGKCNELELVRRIARVPQQDGASQPAVRFVSLSFSRR